MTDWLGLRGRKALVLGAGGLGGASASALAGVGADLVVVDVDEARLAGLRSKLSEDGRTVETIVADLTDPDTCRSVVAQAHAMLGSLDVFLHAVGRNHRVPVLELTDVDWARLVDLNLSSAYWTGQAVGRVMCEQGAGRMVFVSSVSGLLAHRHHAPYAATKGGLNQLIRVMAREWAEHGVGVNAVAPGYIETDLTKDYLAKPGNREELTSLVPAGRLGAVGDVADAVVYLASARSAFVTGHLLYIDGGRTLV